VIPLRFCYQRYKGNLDIDGLYKMMQSVKAEENSIIDHFKNLGQDLSNALQSQAYLQMYAQYCTKGKCLDCGIGAHLMNLKS
ncbi:MAG: DUF2851 domain-containing protein, partial [Maribacter sp.]